MEIYTDVRGKAGIDCGGFCEFCFYKNVNFNDLNPIGCINCAPNQIGCAYCQNFIKRVNSDFKPLIYVLTELERKLIRQKIFDPTNKDLKINIRGGADVFFYPHLNELVSVLEESNLPIRIGYTSGKGIKDEKIAEDLISHGVDEIDFSVFSTTPEMRRRWMKDNNPNESLRALKIFCENINVNASAVVIPEINDQDEIRQTCTVLEEWGVELVELRRFANFRSQGLILNNKPIIEGINSHSYEEFQDIVQKVADEFSFKVFGYPFYDPKSESPFALSKTENRCYLEKLPDIQYKATIITGELAAPFLKRVFRIIDESNLVNIVKVDKEIADLITHEDLEFIDLTEVKSNVVIPRGALVHDKQAEKILCKDGNQRRIARGPLILTYPYSNTNQEYITNKEELIRFELKSLTDLINKINSFKNS